MKKKEKEEKKKKKMGRRRVDLGNTAAVDVTANDYCEELGGRNGKKMTKKKPNSEKE